MVRKEAALRKRHHYKGIISSRRSAYFIYRFLEKARQKTKLVNPFPEVGLGSARNSRGAARGRSAFPLCVDGGRTARPHGGIVRPAIAHASFQREFFRRRRRDRPSADGK